MPDDAKEQLDALKEIALTALLALPQEERAEVWKSNFCVACGVEREPGKRCYCSRDD